MTSAQAALAQLTALKNHLLSDAVQQFWQQQPQHDQFIDQEHAIVARIEEIETAELQKIYNQLQKDDLGLTAGCQNLEKQIESLNNAQQFLNVLATFTGIVDRFVKLVI